MSGQARPRRAVALLVEDDPAVVDLIRSNLRVRGFDTLVSVDGSNALELLEAHAPDIVLLDLILPGADGLELCRRMRERSGAGIIVVSARSEERVKVTALNFGADDYMTKPFGVDELLARIRANLRRGALQPAVLQHTVEVGSLVLDLDLRQATSGGKRIHLTPTEFALLRALALNRDRLLTPAQILRQVWGRGYETETEYVRVYVHRLRVKLQSAGASAVIGARPRVGYALVEAAPASSAREPEL